jgi:hypothetical protein
MSSRRLHYDSALKGKVIAYAEKQKQSLGAETHLILVKQIFILERITEIP